MKNRIREFREQHGLTQKELGGSVGVSRQAIHAVETGKFDPSIWLAHDLAHYFGVTIEELFDFTKEGQYYAFRSCSVWTGSGWFCNC